MVLKQVGVVFFCVALVGAAIGLIALSAQFPVVRTQIGATYGPAFFPRVVLGALIFCGCVLVLDAVRELKVQRWIGGFSFLRELDQETALRALVLWGASVGFYLAWSQFGFVVPSIVFVLFVAWYLRERRISRLLFVATFGPLLYLIFSRALQIRL